MLTAIALSFLMWWQAVPITQHPTGTINAQTTVIPGDTIYPDNSVDPYPGATDVPATEIDVSAGAVQPIECNPPLSANEKQAGVVCGKPLTTKSYSCPDTEHWQLNSNMAGTVHWCHHVPNLGQ